MGKRPVNVEVYVKRGEPLERAFRRFKRRLKKSGVIEEFLKKKRYEKPSATRRKRKMQRQRLIEKQNELRDNGVIGLDEEREYKRKSKRNKTRNRR
tara:strand:- start:247 stop:534 length:288 start_codon:yes stop_codon:yes gene_type:complete